MKELLKRYQDIQDDHNTLNALADKYIAIDDETTTIEQALLITANCLTSVSHEIVRELQQQLDDAEKQLNGPESACGERNPLWAVIAAGEPDYEASCRGIMGSTKYRLFFTKQDALESVSGSIDKKVVPVWGE